MTLFIQPRLLLCMLDRRLEYQWAKEEDEGEEKHFPSTSIKSNIINIRAQIVFLFVSFLPPMWSKEARDMQTLSNFCYWMLIALSIMYDCFIKTKSGANICRLAVAKTTRGRSKSNVWFGILRLITPTIFLSSSHALALAWERLA